MQMLNCVGYRLINKIENSLGLHLFSDKLYLQAMYRLSIGKELCLNNPYRFTEKLQWLKLYGQYGDLTQKTDKYEVKKQIAAIIGPEYIVPTLGVWNNTKDIEWEKLPTSFVLKCTHDSNSLIRCIDKKLLDKNATCIHLMRALSRNYYFVGREPNYKNIVPRIIAEPYLQDNSRQLPDYKFFCFHGKALFYKIDFNRFSFHQANYYNIDGTILPFSEADYPRNEELKNPYPEKIKDMVVLSEKLAFGFPFMRVDWYCVHGQIFFGEMTPFPGSGFIKYIPDEWDALLGNMLELRKHGEN